MELHAPNDRLGTSLQAPVHLARRREVLEATGDWWKVACKTTAWGQRLHCTGMRLDRESKKTSRMDWQKNEERRRGQKRKGSCVENSGVGVSVTDCTQCCAITGSVLGMSTDTRCILGWWFMSTLGVTHIDCRPSLNTTPSMQAPPPL